MAYNVFISYSSKNLHIVDWARSTLAQPGITEVFAAEYSVLPLSLIHISAAARRAVRVSQRTRCCLLYTSRCV